MMEILVIINVIKRYANSVLSLRGLTILYVMRREQFYLKSVHLTVFFGIRALSFENCTDIFHLLNIVPINLINNEIEK